MWREMGEEKEKAKSKCSRCEKEWSCPHHLKVDGLYQLLCSYCVLVTHSHMYCAYCLDDCGSSVEGLLKCSTCPRSVHVGCQHRAAATPAQAVSITEPFLCPHCQNPNSDVMSFALPTNHSQSQPNKKLKGSHGQSVNLQPDFVSAKVILTAARIASTSMHSVAETANAEARKRAIEAARLRKEAKEAIHRAVTVAMEEGSKVHSISPSAATPTAFNANGERMHSGIVSQNLSTSSLTSIPMTKATIAGEPNGPAR